MASETRTLALVFSDIKGFSALMAADEPATLALVEEHEVLLRHWTSRYRGRVVKFLGDGAIWVFDSSADALSCALAVQAACAERNATAATPLVLRIGIHVGEALIRDGDVFGDGVNLAARLEPIAEPGGVAVSHAVRDLLRARPGFTFTSMGLRSLKNLPEPVEVFAATGTPEPPAPAGGPRRSGRPAAATLVVLVAITAFAISYRHFSVALDPAGPSALAAALATRAEPLRVALAPTEALGTGPAVAKALDLRLSATLASTPHLLLVTPPRADALLRPAVGSLGEKAIFNVERVDTHSGTVLSRVYRQGDTLDEVLAAMDEALAEVLTTESPGVTREIVERIVKERVLELKSCYETALERRPDLAGRLEVGWTIEPSGRTSQLAFPADTIGDEPMRACIGAKVEQWLFPATVAGGGEIVWPFVFASPVSE